MLGIVFVVLTVVLAAIGGLVWLLWAQLGKQPDGTRVTLFMPRAGMPIAGGGVFSIELAADLAADGHKAEIDGLHIDDHAMLVLRREKLVLHFKLTAGQGPVNTARLGYVLFDKVGNELSRGTIRPALDIPAGQTQDVQIADADLADTARVEIRKLP
jgi:hypothetical protein